MSYNVTLHEVGFGDCLTLEDDNGCLIVDCANSGYDHIENLGKSSKLLISHFDLDHFGGILNFYKKIPILIGNKPFSTVYLPWCFWSRKNGILETAIAMYLRGLFDIPDKIARLFGILPHICSDIKFLRAGDVFTLSPKTEFDVLWPKYVTNGAHARMPNFLFFLIIIMEISSRTEIPTSDIARDINESARRYRMFFENPLDINRLEKYDPAWENFPDFPMEARFFLDTVVKYLPRIGTSLPNIDIFNLKPFANRLMSSMNACSLVFQDHEEFPFPNERYGLFLGDATKDVINEISGKFAKIYRFIKVQHHATARYACKLPKALYYLISNNGTRREWPISFKQVNYCLNSGRGIVCTCSDSNPNCEYKALKGCSRCLRYGDKIAKGDCKTFY